MPTGSKPRRGGRRRRALGFGYLGLLWLLAVMAAGLAVIGERWTQSAQRERERELIFRGEQIRHAIDRYRRADPARSEWPKSLDDLLEDRRQDEPRYHLRRSVTEPFSPERGWGEIRDPAGGLIGVHSQAGVKALGRWPRDSGAAGMGLKVSDWRFVAAEAVDAAAQEARR